MSYDLIESTLIRLGEEMRERLSASYQTLRPIFHLPVDAIQNDDRRPLLLGEEAPYRRVRVRSQRASHEKNHAC